ncbi:MAG: YigZ family protein, partial [Candidatus Eisenbacteria bacterium]
LATVYPCASAAEAESRLQESRAAHPKATHHVWAWRLLDRGSGILERCDDDGEPGGTAGRPTLQVLQARAIVGAAVVTVRYFGGIKLGAGGLVRAYGAAANAALSDAHVREHIPLLRLRIKLPFPLLGSVESALGREGAVVIGRRFDPEPELLCEVPRGRVKALGDLLGELGAGRISIEPLDVASGPGP